MSMRLTINLSLKKEKILFSFGLTFIVKIFSGSLELIAQHFQRPKTSWEASQRFFAFRRFINLAHA